MARHLEVHVDGEVFLLDQEIMPASFRRKLGREIVLDGFPGGCEAFELVARLCYGNGKTGVTPGNACILRLAAHLLEAAEADSSPVSMNWAMQAEKCIDGMSNWTNSELLAALRQCEEHFQLSDSCGVLERVLGSLAGRIGSASDTVLCDSSPESSRPSIPKTSAGSFPGRSWWVEDLAAFHVDSMEKVVQIMVSSKLDHAIICKFLIYYLKSRCSIVPPDEKMQVIEKVADLLGSLDRNSVSCKGLFEVLRLSSASPSLKNRTREALDSIIGSILDRATLDNMLILAPTKIGTLYDVDQVLRFLKSFLQQSHYPSLDQLKKVGSLMDLYLAEAAPDPGLRPRTFLLLAVALPTAARDSFDGVYRAIDMYIELHPGLLEEEKIMICCALNYEKLSLEVCKHLARNAKMPSWAVVKAIMAQQAKLRGLLQSSDNLHFPGASTRARGRSFHGEEQTVLYARRIGASVENEKLKANLQGMQWKVMELEDVCRKMQNQVRDAAAAKATLVVAGKRPSRFLPRLCS